MKKIQLTELLIFIVITELVGALSGLITGNAFSYYSELTKPSLSPPSAVFPAVWFFIYALMGVSAYMIYVSDASDSKKKFALTLYGLQLFVNFLWSIVFFKFQQMGLSVAVIIILLILIIFMIMIFRKISPAAAYINLPYLIWTIFAAYLNIGILVLNWKIIKPLSLITKRLYNFILLSKLILGYNHSYIIHKKQAVRCCNFTVLGAIGVRRS